MVYKNLRVKDQKDMSKNLQKSSTSKSYKFVYAHI